MTGAGADWGRFLSQSPADGFRTRFGSAFAGQTVCIAGAGGFIGSALVNALAPEGLQSLILLDSSEYGLFRIQRRMETAHPAVSSIPVLGSIGDDRLVDEVFSRYRPDIVFHAAAFKHVGLLERNPFSAIANNALSTWTLAQAALRHAVSRLVLVSTDKAVRPHSVMGVSKRIAELMTLAQCRTNAVRLANVIGSTGSVVPLFLEQISQGEPLSVTHAEASRYFLTADETVTAILAAGAAPCEGRVLMPEFGEPVRIAELARFLASACNHAEIPIRFTGLRPGEKVTEDLIGPGETPVGTVDGPLTVVETHRLSRADGARAATQLSECVASRRIDRLLETILRLVPEYVPGDCMQCSDSPSAPSIRMNALPRLTPDLPEV